MYIRAERYVMIDSTLNCGPNYWNQDLFPAWASLSTFQYMPGLRMGAGAVRRLSMVTGGRAVLARA